MDNFGIWSLIPPIAAIILAIKTRQVFVSLIAGIWFGWLILSDGNFIDGTINTAQAIIDVFKDSGNTRTIIFTGLIGGLIAMIQRSGGVEGFINYINIKLKTLEHNKKDRSRTVVQLFAALSGLLIFIETNISVLTVGTVFRPLFDKLKIPREKLAFIADSTSAPSSILIPLNAWGAYIMGLLAAQGFSNPFQTLLSAFLFNFYPMIIVAIVFLIIIFKKDFGPMQKAEQRAAKEGKVLRDGAEPLLSAEITKLETKENITPSAKNMMIPLGVMIFTLPVMLVYTGWTTVENNTSLPFHQKLFEAIGQASGSASVLYSILISLIVSIVMFSFKKIFTIKESTDLILRGISGLIPMAVLMILAFAIGNVCRELGTGYYAAEITKEWLSPEFLPLLIFITSAFISFSTGTSWGTFAIMIAIGVPVAQATGADISLTIAATLGGGVFGDHCSPISDTTIISSMASASDHIDHVKTQLPYALTGGVLTAVLYVLFGMIF